MISSRVLRRSMEARSAVLRWPEDAGTNPPEAAPPRVLVLECHQKREAHRNLDDVWPGPSGQHRRTRKQGHVPVGVECASPPQCDPDGRWVVLVSGSGHCSLSCMAALTFSISSGVTSTIPSFLARQRRCGALPLSSRPDEIRAPNSDRPSERSTSGKARGVRQLPPPRAGGMQPGLRYLYPGDPATTNGGGPMSECSCAGVRTGAT